MITRCPLKGNNPSALLLYRSLVLHQTEKIVHISVVCSRFREFILSQHFALLMTKDNTAFRICCPHPHPHPLNSWYWSVIWVMTTTHLQKQKLLEVVSYVIINKSFKAIDFFRLRISLCKGAFSSVVHKKVNFLSYLITYQIEVCHPSVPPCWMMDEVQIGVELSICTFICPEWSVPRGREGP